MADVSVKTINLKDVAEYLKNMPEDTFTQAKTVMSKGVAAINKQVKDNATNILNVRSGRLRRSLQFEVSGTNLKNIQASVYSASVVGGSPVAYAPIHEYGGTIKAKNKYKGVPGGPYLNIPTDANKTPAGVTRLNARQVFQAGGYIGGRVVFNNADEPMFYLVKSVTIPARLGMEAAAEDEIPTILSGLASVIGE